MLQFLVQIILPIPQQTSFISFKDPSGLWVKGILTFFSDSTCYHLLQSLPCPVRCMRVQLPWHDSSIFALYYNGSLHFSPNLIVRVTRK